MNTIFDKIYILSLISNKRRQEFIRYQMEQLGLDFEFIYGIDFYNLKNGQTNNRFFYPKVIRHIYHHLDNDKLYGCTIGHYQAVLQAYEFGYNNVLIIEDDACFLKDKEIIEEHLNNIPKDADFVTYTARFLQSKECKIFRKEVNKFHKKHNDKYIKLSNDYLTLCGTMCYGLMNRNIMKKYLDNQRIKLKAADHIKDIYENSIVNRYIAVQAICTDQFNLITKNKCNKKLFGCCYNQFNIIKNFDDFFEPEWYEISNINEFMNNSLSR